MVLITVVCWCLLCCLSVVLQPHEVTAKKMGVGACAWEGEMLLAAYLLSECAADTTTAKAHTSLITSCCRLVAPLWL